MQLQKGEGTQTAAYFLWAICLFLEYMGLPKDKGGLGLATLKMVLPEHRSIRKRGDSWLEIIQPAQPPR